MNFISMADEKDRQQCSNTRNNNNKKKSNRKHKSKSLIVPSTIDSVDDDTNGSRSADCDSSTFDLRHRFSFCSFRRGRSLSKTRDTSSAATTPVTEPNGPILIVNHVDDDKQTTTTTTNPSIRKSRSVVDFRSICSKLHRHLTIGMDPPSSI